MIYNSTKAQNVIGIRRTLKSNRITLVNAVNDTIPVIPV